MKFTKGLVVTIKDDELVRILIDALAPSAEVSTGKERTLYSAFAHLVGIQDTEAVRLANKQAKKNGYPTITTKEFRYWLPTTLSDVFGGFIKRASTRATEEEL